MTKHARPMILACALLLLPACATTNLMEWVNKPPERAQFQTATIVASDGTTATVYETGPNPERALRMFGAFYAILPCLAWDIVTLPVQVLIGSKPYGD